jgi:hypothetical protein
MAGTLQTRDPASRVEREIGYFASDESEETSQVRVSSPVWSKPPPASPLKGPGGAIKDSRAPRRLFFDIPWPASKRSFEVARATNSGKPRRA